MYIKKDKRPEKIPKSKIKSKNINVRVTPGEHERIRLAGAKQGMNITQFVESLIFGAEEK